MSELQDIANGLWVILIDIKRVAANLLDVSYVKIYYGDIEGELDAIIKLCERGKKKVAEYRRMGHGGPMSAD